MSPKRALQVVLGISLFGASFSGVLTYKELFAHRGASCPTVGTPGTVFGYPACVYGFFMYLAIVIVTMLGLSGAEKEGAAT
ncbi:MAG TPA: hypothetical protein VMT93_08560 [Gemmatimonadaceae bacterium]|nr:hypothetical protein [Gemmatimonadaceae bacterium]